MSYFGQEYNNFHELVIATHVGLLICVYGYLCNVRKISSYCLQLHAQREFLCDNWELYLDVVIVTIFGLYILVVKLKEGKINFLGHIWHT